MTGTRLKMHDNPPPLRGCKGRIGVSGALNLGDMLCAVRALRAVRAASPKARVTVIGLPWARELIVRYRDYVDDFLPFPGHPQLPETRAHRADYGHFRETLPGDSGWLIQRHGDGRLTNGMLAEWPARRRAGFAQAGARGEGYFLPCPSGARCLAGNDTSPSHPGAAPHTPRLVVTGSDPARRAPEERRRHRGLDGRAGLSGTRFLDAVSDLWEYTGRTMC